jgi:hypothetical protein
MLHTLALLPGCCVYTSHELERDCALLTVQNRDYLQSSDFSGHSSLPKGDLGGSSCSNNRLS